MSPSQYACLLCTVANLILRRHSKCQKKTASTRIIQNIFYTPFSGYQLRARRFRQILAKAICLSQNSTGNDEDQWKKTAFFIAKSSTNKHMIRGFSDFLCWIARFGIKTTIYSHICAKFGVNVDFTTAYGDCPNMLTGRI